MAKRTYQLDGGAVRILFAMTVWELALLTGTALAVNTFWPNIGTLVLGIAAGRLAVSVKRNINRKLPSQAFLHVRLWLSQADVYEVMPDPEPRAIVSREKP
jgi:hypothetical protein